jgi:hypothetical protein
VHEADHIPPSSAEVENEWSCISAPPPPHMPLWHGQEQLLLHLGGDPPLNLHVHTYDLCSDRVT